MDKLDWLLEKDNPSVRYLTLTTLLGEDINSPQAREAAEDIMRLGPVTSILSEQNEDGSWGEPDRFYRDKYKGTVWNLLLLAELCADPENKKIKKAAEFVLSNSFNPESGGFSYDASAKSGGGLFSGVIPCLTGNMVFALLRLGFSNDERLKKAIEWIVSNQRTDDQSDIKPTGKVYERYDMCWGRHSCHMGVAKAFKALAEIKPEYRTPAVSAKLNELSEYFLAHHIFKKSHQLEQIAKPGWLKFGFPLMYQTDVLELLDIFARLKIHDARLAEAIQVVVENKTAEGIWKLKNTFNGRTITDFELKGKPSKWITLKALRVLKEYGG